MKKILILLLPILLLTGCSSKNKSITKTVTDKVKEKAKSYTYKSLKSAIALGVPLKCTYKINEIEYEGYIKGKNWRGNMSQQGKTTNIILKDNCMYAWSNEAPQGTKMCFEEDVWESEEGGFQQPNVDYICSPAVFGDDKFSPPSSIQFMDLNNINSLMKNQGIPEGLPTQK